MFGPAADQGTPRRGTPRLSTPGGPPSGRPARTATTTFGVSGRNSHDARSYYARQLARTPPVTTRQPTNAIGEHVTGRVYQQSSETMAQLPDNSVGLIVTSPPYHVGKDYDTDTTWDEFCGMLEAVLAECVRVLEVGGRLAVNVAGLGRKPYIPYHHLIGAMCDRLGLWMRAEIVWRKAAGANGSAAFGSWMGASNPVLRDVHEYVLVYSKGQMGRCRAGTSTIGRDAFLRDTLSVWDIRPEQASRVGHPAPFPVELPRRLIELYSYADDVIVDPFAGAGTTAIAAIDAGRRWVCYELDEQYAALAERRIRTHQRAHDTQTGNQPTN